VFLSLNDLELRKIQFDLTFLPGEIEFSDPKLWQATPLHIKGEAELVDHTEGEIRVRGHLEVRMEAECDRCLETASFPVDTSFDLLYRPSSAAVYASPEAEVAGEETEIGFYDGGGVELRDVIREHVLLSLPMRKVCSEACKGICPECGQNRNQAQCHCEVKPADDRWAALRDLSPPVKE
jgi:uncharacterized protein